MGEPPQDTPRAAATVQPSQAASVLAAARSFRDAATWFLAEPARLRERAQEQYRALRHWAVHQRLSAMPVEKLRDAGTGGLRIGNLRKAGYDSVGAVAAARPEHLLAVPGVGQATAQHAQQAAWNLAEAAEREMVVRLDPDARPSAQTELIGTLRALQVAEHEVSEQGHTTRAALDEVEALGPLARRATHKARMFFARRRKKDEALSALGRLDTLLAEPRVADINAAFRRVAASTETRDPNSLWLDYEHRAAAYNTKLAELAGSSAEPGGSATGHIPTELEREIRAVPLDTSLLTVTLRGYQDFGAKYAISREKSILGDEMGLGKTIQALATMAHIAAHGRRHFLVVCPASVVMNWADETARHSKLKPYTLHGTMRQHVIRTWLREGGVAVTTFETLQRLRGLDEVRVGLLVVDEAHYVKNPDAKRSRAVADAGSRAERTLFLTGTPMENKVEEFRNLVDYLQPAVAAKVSVQDTLAGATAFRRAVAPVYLRRNQDDVLTELPDKLELEDWVELGPADHAAYRSAVQRSNFMAMRQAAYQTGLQSAKIERLREIVEESRENGWKVIVFSYFLDVLQTVQQAVGEAAMSQPLTGALGPNEKQALVAEFGNRDGHAVLASQITAGGVGLNIQAASVVILAEPQLKPSTENQAIARAHRMGQTRKVHVHRLLAKDTVDQRLMEVLEGKARLFDAYARESAAKLADPAAVDRSYLNADLLHDADVPVDRRIVQVERQRLGLD
ncbi:ATP-dependent helicase [Allosaccharopolyspora coralli]|uniref:ATP-dependent helicase n=1 Tax=Allosaccharopolyspora coralli TaxID=2665642 RepID=A0A5Q3Q3K8_9PSEU|nr:DEAD/DEAH box helicase [Allosaccharopolyspora coralli]QGK68923.1 ATP-dependent helicase [Allosaccharopolyspora coralli]